MWRDTGEQGVRWQVIREDLTGEATFKLKPDRQQGSAMGRAREQAF